jgi:hypothetical protein
LHFLGRNNFIVNNSYWLNLRRNKSKKDQRIHFSVYVRNGKIGGSTYRKIVQYSFLDEKKCIISRFPNLIAGLESALLVNVIINSGVNFLPIHDCFIVDPHDLNKIFTTCKLEMNLLYRELTIWNVINSAGNGNLAFVDYKTTLLRRYEYVKDLIPLYCSNKSYSLIRGLTLDDWLE